MRETNIFVNWTRTILVIIAVLLIGLSQPEAERNGYFLAVILMMLAFMFGLPNRHARYLATIENTLSLATNVARLVWGAGILFVFVTMGYYALTELNWDPRLVIALIISGAILAANFVFNKARTINWERWTRRAEPVDHV